MTQYFNGFTDYTVDTVPSNFTQRWDSGLVGTVRADARGTDGRVLELVNTLLANRHMLSWDDIDADPGRANVEVLIKFYQEATETDADNRVALRASGTGSSETGYTSGYARSDGAIRHGRYVNASFSNMGSVSRSYPDGAWYLQRTRLIGADFKTRVWPAASAEPTTWDLEESNVSITQAGWVGFFAYNANAWGLIDFIGVGTGGDPAPTGPVDPGGDEVGDITSAASSTDSWAAQVQSSVSLTSTAAASDQATAIASVNLSIMEAAQATDATGDAPAAVGSMTGAATGNDTVDALASAAAAISAGAAAGESWTVQAQVLVNLVEQGAASDEIRRQTESAVTAALESQSLAADQFIAALDTIASLSDSASVTDAYQAVVLQLASIASGAVASDGFRMLFGLQRALQEAAVASDSFSISYAFVNALRSGGLSGDAWALMVNLNASLSDVCSVADLMSVRASTTARLTAGAIASSSFAIVNAGVRYLVMGAVILRDALQYRVNTKPALNQSVKIKPGH